MLNELHTCTKVYLVMVHLGHLIGAVTLVTAAGDSGKIHLRGPTGQRQQPNSSAGRADNISSSLESLNASSPEGPSWGLGSSSREAARKVNRRDAGIAADRSDGSAQPGESQ